MAALLAAIASLSAGSAYAACDDEHAIWEATHDGVRDMLSIVSDDKLAMAFVVAIEEWRGPKLAWRVQADISCSMGEVTCSLSVPNMLSADDASKEAEDYSRAVVERIDEDGDGNSEWIVLANLRQELYYAGGAQVEFFDGFGREYPDERIIIPNVFKFASCRDGSAVAQKSDASPAPRLDQQISGPVYGIPALCEAYNRDGTLVPRDDGGPGSFADGLWWMDDNRVVGWEFDCTIIKKTMDATIELSCKGEGSEWTESSKYVDEGNVRRVDDVELKRCKG